MRTDGLYQRRGYYYFKYKAAEGWKERATHTRNYTEAKRARSAFLNELSEGKLPNERSRWPLEQAVDQWLPDRRYRIAAGTYASEKAITRTLLRILGATTRLEEVADILVIRGFETTRLAEGVSPKTVNNEINILAGILRAAKLWRRVEPDYKRLPVKNSDIGIAFTKEESQSLLRFAATASDDAVAIYAAVLSYSAGLRAREIKRLRIGSIHLDSAHPYLQVKRATTKTNAGARFVALDTMACWALRKLLNRAHRLGSCGAEHYLLPTRRDRHTRTGDPLHGGKGFDPLHPQSSWDAEWEEVKAHAGIVGRRFHDLRHTYISRAAEAGVPLEIVKAQVGHLSTAMSAYYTHISDGALHHAARQIEQHDPDLLKQLGLPAHNPADSDDHAQDPHVGDDHKHGKEREDVTVH